MIGTLRIAHTPEPAKQRPADKSIGHHNDDYNYNKNNHYRCERNLYIYYTVIIIIILILLLYANSKPISLIYLISLKCIFVLNWEQNIKKRANWFCIRCMIQEFLPHSMEIQRKCSKFHISIIYLQIMIIIIIIILSIIVSFWTLICDIYSWSSFSNKKKRYKSDSNSHSCWLLLV